MAGVDSRKLRRHQVTCRDEQSRIIQAAQKIGKAHVYFVDSQQQTIMSVHGIAAKLAAKLTRDGVKFVLIVIDLVTLLKPSGDAAKKNREQQVAEMSRGLRFLAEEYNCHVMGLAHLNRGAAQRKGEDRYPRVEDLRESGSLEQDADNVLLLHRDKDERGMFIPNAPAALIVGKQRDGGTAFLQLGMQPGYVRFTDYEGDGGDASGRPFPDHEEQY